MEKVSQAAVRDITRKLQLDVRNDWDFPLPSVHDSLSRHATGVEKWRERYYGETDDEDNDEGVIIGEAKHESSDDDGEQDPYQFDSPDAVGGIVEGKRQARKRKRREQLEKEIKHNEGLCFFLARRNAWTGAKRRNEVEGPQHERQASTSTDSGFSSAHTENTAPSSPGAGSAESPAQTPMTPLQEQLRMTSVSQEPHPQSPFHPPHPPSNLTDVLVPITRPLIPPTNPVRMSMYGRQLSELYDKIVRDTRSPAIPINLAHMTRVIVQGWKDEGNWPPQSGLPEPSIATSRRNFGLSSAAVADTRNRVRKSITLRSGAAVDGGLERSLVDGHAGGSAQKSLVDGGAHGIFAHHPGRHIRQGIDGVKRVLRLSGSHLGSGRPKSTDSKSTAEPLSPRSPQSPLSPKFGQRQSLDGN